MIKINDNCSVQGNGVKYCGYKHVEDLDYFIQKLNVSDNNNLELFKFAFPKNDRFKYMTDGDVNKLKDSDPVIVPFSLDANTELIDKTTISAINREYYLNCDDIYELQVYVKEHYPNATERLNKHWFGKFFEEFRTVYGGYVIFRDIDASQFYFALFLYENIETSDICYTYGLEVQSYDDLIGTSSDDVNMNYEKLKFIE